MKNGFKILQELTFPNYIVYQISSTYIGKVVYFEMLPEQVSIGTYYDGRMVVTEAKNPALIGKVLEGWQNDPQLDVVGSWYKSRVEVQMKNWLCFHSTVFKRCECIDLIGNFTLPANSTAFVGIGTVYIDGVNYPTFSNINPSPSERNVAGSGKLFVMS